MHLKSLTLRGFKSFASSTQLLLEPGITCIVGPNGSGKSNVVDALAWVMGEQGAKSLRGGRMEDVVFAGTADRPPLGRAEVVLTIDNSDGALPIDYTEVTISRTLFRNGGSEYAINGHTCRLLDVQELLGDSGIGREMHVIVGQGQLDAILSATPEDRRGFLEEAAGVLKYRKRKEKALRKLEATEGNLTRLSDLLTEVRRQLTPLGRQAEVARRASTIQRDVRDARARLLADEVVGARTAVATQVADEDALRNRRRDVEQALRERRATETQAEVVTSSTAPRLGAASETWFALAGLRERFRGVQSLSADRMRHLADEPAEEVTGRDPDALVADAERLAEEEAAGEREVTDRRAVLDVAVERRVEAERAAAEEDRRVAALLRAAADQREGRARLSGRIDSLRSRAAAADDEIGRLEAARQEALSRAERARHDYTALETRIAGLDAGERGLDAEHEGAAAQLFDIDSRLAKLREEVSTADRERAALTARADALASGLARPDGATALLGTAAGLPGLLGSVATVITVREGYETAVSAALGTAADAVAVTGVDAAVAAIEHLKESEAGRSGLLLADTADDGAPPTGAALPAECRWLLDVVAAPESLQPALRRLLGSTVVVPDLERARVVVTARPELVAVTVEGDVLGRPYAAGGSTETPTRLEVQAAVDAASSARDEATAAAERLRFELSALEAERAEAQARLEVAVAKLHESDATLAAVAEELAQYGSATRSARAEAERIDVALSAVREARDVALDEAAELEARLTAPDAGSVDEDPDATELSRLSEVAAACRAAETEARLALRTAEERARALHGRAASLRAAAEQEGARRIRARERRDRRTRQARVAAAVHAAACVVLARLEESLAAAAHRRSEIERMAAEAQERLARLRTEVRELEAELTRLTDDVHRDELVRAEYRLRIETLEQRALDDLGLNVDALVADYGPDRPVAAERPEEGDPVAEPMPYDRDEQLRRLRAGERALAALGRINPLALEEFAALEERHRFLTEQLEDLRTTRSDLLDIVRDVDARVEQVVADAYRDVAREFEAVFPRLFPGGEGRLVLTDPDDMLATGVEVEARPPGKKVKRLSLLSGGERSLVAVAFLVALFKARPSPFYILDEVEAALDDTNLGRLLEIYEELRSTSQLVVITHQKRTMEVADALYGVSMRGDGVSTLISSRLRDGASA